MDFVIGLILGAFCSFIAIKLQIKRSGAGEMRVCKSCPCYLSSKFNDFAGEDSE